MDNVSLLYPCSRNVFHLMILEALMIKELKPSLNKKDEYRSRELVITIYRLIFLRDGKVVAAVKSGKAKTAVQMGTLGFLYVHFMYKFHYKATGDYTFVEWFFPEGIMYFLLFLSVALTLYSGYRFFIKNWKLVQQANERYLYV